jgi:hypothetical protein
MARAAKLITASQLFETLAAAGIVRRDEMVRRVVIDCQAGSVPVVYVERVGDERLLSVVQTLGGVEIDVVRPEEEATRDGSSHGHG